MAAGRMGGSLRRESSVKRWAWRPQSGPQQALVVRLRSFAVKLSWRRPIVSISAAKSSSCPREHPRTAHGIHAANVGLCESPIQKVAWGDERRAVSGSVGRCGRRRP